MKNKKLFLGIGIFIVLIVAIILIKNLGTKTDSPEDVKGLTTVYVATGGGKEDFLQDEDVVNVLRKKYKLNVIFDTWSNGKTITKPLIREAVGLGNQNIINDLNNGIEYTVQSEGVSKYDAKSRWNSR